MVNGSENTRSSTKRLREGATGPAMRLCLRESGAERQKKSTGGAGTGRRGGRGWCLREGDESYAATHRHRGRATGSDAETCAACGDQLGRGRWKPVVAEPLPPGGWGERGDRGEAGRRAGDGRVLRRRECVAHCPWGREEPGQGR